ncbi:MAG TPA: HD domain-containing phosphohydrolase [Chthonomonadaceae bacterium]|nr:HD domain-containing phosphohydrolase [Chthonomonadaceae bacterium]
MGKVLLADDEDALRLLMGRQLRRAGHEVTLAEDGMVAAELLTTQTFDVVVSDMKMPRLDGMGLLARAKELAPDTEFIILTGHGNMENAIEAFKTGNVFDYLLKPLDDIQELDGVVARALERRYLRNENIRLVSELEQQLQELEDARNQLAQLAEHDGLTNLLNHRTIHARLEQLLKNAPDASLSVMMLDMDRFKQLNDTYGHPVGDQALRHIARTLCAVCDEHALLGRCGGDEFMVVLPNHTAAQARDLAECAKQHISQFPFRNPEGTALPLQLCFGISDVASAGYSAVSLVAAADAALYEGKQRGGDAVTLHLVTAEEDRREQSSFDVLDGLVNAIDLKDKYTRKHSEHMTGFALQLAQAMNCSEETYNIVRVAGLLHDVGKIGVPDSILRKPGKLSEEEYEIMKNHVTLSSLIIHGIPHLSDILDAVANHHERWDGKGYPRGLAGEQIPLLGRIMAIADAFSAMTLDRPYRAGMDPEVALGEIEKGAGAQFDPNLVPIFVSTVRAGLSASPQELRKAA